jgi:hypothetical protein
MRPGPLTSVVRPPKMIQIFKALQIRIACTLALMSICLSFGCVRRPGFASRLQRFQLKGETGTLGIESTTHLTELAIVEAVPLEHQPSSDFQLEINFSNGESVTISCAGAVEFTDNVARATSSGHVEQLGVATSWSWVAYAALPNTISVIKFIARGKIIAVQEFNPPLNASTAPMRWPNQSSKRTPPRSGGSAYFQR